MNEELREGWRTVPLGDIADILDSQRIPLNSTERAQRPGHVPYYGATGQVGWIDAPLFNEELVLLGEDGAPFLDPSKPKAYIIDGPSWVNNHAHVLRARAGLTTNRYLKHFLDWTPYRDHVTGTTRLKLTQRAMRAMPVRLPPLVVQEQLVDLLEDHLSRLDVATSSLAAAAARLDQFRSQMLASELQRPAQDLVRMSDLLVAPLANGRSVPTASGDGFPVLRLTCLRDGTIDTSETKLGHWGDQDPNRFVVQPGDFLISRGNGSLHLVGRGGLVAEGAPQVAFPDTLIRARVDAGRIQPDFLRLVWHSRSVRRQIESQARTTAGIYKINQSMIEKIEVPVPKLQRQREIVGRMDLVEAAVGRLRADLDQATSRSGTTRRAILLAAFSGALSEEMEAA